MNFKQFDRMLDILHDRDINLWIKLIECPIHELSNPEIDQLAICSRLAKLNK